MWSLFSTVVQKHGEQAWQTTKNSELSSTAALEGFFAFIGQKSSVMRSSGKEQDASGQRADPEDLQTGWAYTVQAEFLYYQTGSHLEQGKCREKDNEGDKETRGSVAL